jgi:hypothetical protein
MLSIYERKRKKRTLKKWSIAALKRFVIWGVGYYY